ncbi:MAG: response regulator transcription factor [Planctomycetaceae bacterium]|nr:response regulator transcription factor [Planctomycetaceae bacterium]
MSVAPKRILIVEDEEAIANGLRFNLQAEGYEATVFGDGPSTLSYIEEHPGSVDLILLDLMLPGMSGYEICRSIRELEPILPILVLSARTLTEDRAHAFECGADQYMAKPFALPELLSRTRNLLSRNDRLMKLGESRARSQSRDNYAFNGVEVDFRKFEVRRGDEVFTLTTLEMQLLAYFIDHEGNVMSRSRILKDVWEQGADVSTRTIDNFVMRLRKYLEADPAYPRHLLSVRGTGYRFVAHMEE